MYRVYLNCVSKTLSNRIQTNQTEFVSNMCWMSFEMLHDAKSENATHKNFTHVITNLKELKEILLSQSATKYNRQVTDRINLFLEFNENFNHVQRDELNTEYFQNVLGKMSRIDFKKRWRNLTKSGKLVHPESFYRKMDRKLKKAYDMIHQSTDEFEKILTIQELVTDFESEMFEGHIAVMRFVATACRYVYC